MEPTNILKDLLDGSSNNQKFLEYFYTNKFEKWILIIVVILFIISIPTYFISYTNPYWPYPLFLAFALILLYVLSSLVVSPFKFLLNPTKSRLEVTEQHLEKQVLLIQRISTNTSWNIENARCRIDRDIESMQNRLRFLIGAFDKLGIIPAILGLYLTHTEILKESIIPNFNESVLEGNISFYIACFIMGVYLGAIVITDVINKYIEFRLILTQAKALAEEREALNKQ